MLLADLAVAGIIAIVVLALVASTVIVLTSRRRVRLARLEGPPPEETGSGPGSDDRP